MLQFFFQGNSRYWLFLIRYNNKAKQFPACNGVRRVFFKGETFVSDVIKSKAYAESFQTFELIFLPFSQANNIEQKRGAKARENFLKQLGLKKGPKHVLFSAYSFEATGILYDWIITSSYI